jgi:hypothetical protein
MQKMETDVDVLVVGAGPVGLFLANECARRGLRSRIIETRPTQSKYSKALAIFPRTLEIFDMAGLDLVLHGHGNEALLDSYTAERRPVIKQVVETTDFMTKALGTPNKLAQLLRNTVIPMVSRLAPFQHAFVQRLSELGVAYSGSPIVKGAGKRHFDDTLRGGNGILSRFLLLIGQDADAPTKEAAQELTSTFKDVVELRPHASHDIMLVRPDGYIAFSAADHDTAAALQHVRTLLQRQTGSVLSAA